MSGRSRTQLLVLLALTLCVPVLTGWRRDLVQVVVEVGCVGLCWLRLRAEPDLVGKGWGLVAAGTTLTAFGDATAAIEVNVFHPTTLLPPSTVIVMIGYVVLGAGGIMFDRKRVKAKNRTGTIEAAIFGLGGLAPVLVFLVLPQIAVDAPIGSRISVAGYALADLMIITVIARLLLTDSSRSRSLLYLSGALVVTLGGDFLSGATSFQGSHSSSGAVEFLWLLGYLGLAVGYRHPSLRGLTYGTYVDSDRVSPRSQVALLAIGLLLPGLSLTISLLRGDSRYLMLIAVIGLAVSTLVAARITSLMTYIGQQSDQLSSMARSDELTGLPNRRSWNHAVVRACDVARSSGDPLCLALFDLDRFKDFNDSYGHPAGDALLRDVSRLWSEALRDGEFVARYGGEEFAMLLPGISLDEAVLRLDELRRLVPAPQSASVGVALWMPGTDPALTLADADDALYLAKRSGRDRTVAAEFALDSMPGPLRDLLIVVQPIIRLDDLAVVAHEGLSRFPHTTDIDAVFADAHEKDYGDLLELAAIERILERTDRPVGTEVYVNVSERAMRSDRFWAGVPDDLVGVVVELSEQRDGLDDDTVAAFLDRFRRRGARIGLDDVGSAATDFARIASLRPDVAKIDRSLVAGCDRHESRAAVLRMIIGFARAHGAEVCVEGVETEGEFEVSRAAGASYAQGYYFGRAQQDWTAAVLDVTVTERPDQSAMPLS